MLVSKREFAQISHWINEPNAYSRYLDFKMESPTTHLGAFMGLWIFTEYFSENLDQLSEMELFNLKAWLNCLNSHGGWGAHGGIIVQNREGGATLKLPMLSANSWDLLFEIVETIAYWTIADHKITLSQVGRARLIACTSAQEVLAFWARAIKQHKVFPQREDLGKMGLTKLFDRFCMRALGVRKLLLDPNSELWKALYFSEVDVSGLRRVFLKNLVETIPFDKDWRDKINDFLCQGENPDGYAQRAFIDLALVMDADTLEKSFLDEDKEDLVKISNLVFNQLMPASSLDADEKHLLLQQTAFFLSQGQLAVLANEYVANNWKMFRAIRHKAWDYKGSALPSLNYDNIEVMGNATAKVTWPACYKKLEAMIAAMERSSAYSYLNPLTMFTAVRSEIFMLLDDTGLDVLNPIKDGELNVFRNQWRETYPHPIVIRRSDLPVVLQRRLEKLKPEPAKASQKNDSLMVVK